jgi:putative addiction module component (TIGR02574 family)
MTATIQALGIDRMTAADRLRLIEEIWDSLAADPDAVPLTDAQRDDLSRRLEAFKENPKAGSTWDVVKARLKGQP